jgi:hypothetical protein
VVGFEQMLRRRQINGDPGGRGVRFLLGLADAARWPFERAGWAIERAVLWPLQERLAGWESPGRGTGGAALIAIAGAAVLAGALLLPAGDDAPGERVAPAPVAVATPEPQRSAEPQGPELQGAPPSFGVGTGVGVAAAESGAGGELNSGSSDDAAVAGGEPGESAEDATATASASGKPVPAGPAAMKVARRFSEAFVFYEVGQRPARARTVFGETATPRLAMALDERPPRQPAETEVPKARVLNLVPGPRAGRAYTVSVSLLRVGLTSELRLELGKQKGTWLVTDVRG